MGQFCGTQALAFSLLEEDGCSWQKPGGQGESWADSVPE